MTVGGLKQRIDRRELENAVRDYISQHPWLVSPKWETFAVETGMKGLLDEALSESGIVADTDFKGRVDLALSTGDHLLILEFMRPGLRIDWDHLIRFERYVRLVRTNLGLNTGGRFRRSTGYIVADKLHSRAEVVDKIRAMDTEDMFALDWPTLFANAVAQWEDFLVILAGRNPQDERLQAPSHCADWVSFNSGEHRGLTRPLHVPSSPDARPLPTDGSRPGGGRSACGSGEDEQPTRAHSGSSYPSLGLGKTTSSAARLASA